MKTVQYKAWRDEFDKLVKAYLLGIEWEKILFNNEDFGVLGDDLQWDAYKNIYFSINAETDAGFDHNPDVAEWVHYDESCENRTDFEIDLKNDWDVVLEARNKESKMDNKAETFLKIWVNQYEQSRGEISKPDFAGITKAYSDRKRIPHYAFDDLSVMIVVLNHFGSASYEVCENAIELDHEWEMESDQLGFESVIVDIFTL